MLRRHLEWPTPSNSELVSLSQLLVIDDKEFEYVPMFEREGYHITVWEKVRSLQRLESGEFHVILLDMRGIGLDEVDYQGAGLIEHIKAVNPAQYVIAYSSARFTLDYQRFFEQADDRLKKSEDFSRFKRAVDQGLAHRFSEDYYQKVVEQLLDDPPDRKTERLMRSALRGRDTDKLRERLTARGINSPDIDRILTVCSIAASSLSLLVR